MLVYPTVTRKLRHVTTTEHELFFLYLVLDTTSSCDLKLFRNIVALEKDKEQVSFINMRIKVLWECPDQEEEVAAKHIANI